MKKKRKKNKNKFEKKVNKNNKPTTNKPITKFGYIHQKQHSTQQQQMPNIQNSSFTSVQIHWV